MISTTVLSSLKDLPRPLLTAYVNTQSGAPSAHGPSGANLVWLKKQVKQLIENIPPRDQEPFRKQAAKIEKFLGERTPREKSLVIFAGPNTWQIIPLRLPVQPELRWGNPGLTQLQWILNENKPYCLVVLDRKAARFFRYSLGEMQEIGRKALEIDTSQWKKKDLGHFSGQGITKTRGSQRDTYAHRVDAQYRRLCTETASQVYRFFRANKCSAVVLAGSDELIELVQEKLPAAVRRRTVMVSEDLDKLSVDELQPLLISAIADWEEAEESKLISHMLEDRRKSVRGIDETLAQLQKGKLRTVVLARPLNGTVHECTECGWIDHSVGPNCPACGRERRDVELREILIEAGRTTNTDIQVVSGPAAQQLKQVGGMAGWLRGRTLAELR